MIDEYLQIRKDDIEDNLNYWNNVRFREVNDCEWTIGYLGCYIELS